MSPSLTRAAAWLGLLGLLGLLGCGAQTGASRAAPVPPAAREEIIGLSLTLQHVDADLAQGFVAGAADCDRACLLRGHICALADRICAIAARHPGDVDARERCRDARERCQRARDRVAERCRCL